MAAVNDELDKNSSIQKKVSKLLDTRLDNDKVCFPTVILYFVLLICLFLLLFHFGIDLDLM